MVKNAGKSGKKTSRARLPSTRRDRKPVVAVIGAGRLGTALGQALNKAGYHVEIVVARHQTSAHRAAKLIGKDTAGLSVQQLNRLSPNQADRLSRCRLILVSTPDDAIAPVVLRISSSRSSRSVRFSSVCWPNAPLARYPNLYVTSYFVFLNIHLAHRKMAESVRHRDRGE